MTAPIRENLSGLDLRAEIDRLRKDRNAVILAHYYQKPEIQDLADFVGDSLELSRKAADTDAEVIAFCGVKFMAETAKILSPEKIVILPDMDARSEEHTSELQSLMRISYAVFCLKKKNTNQLIKLHMTYHDNITTHNHQQ